MAGRELQRFVVQICSELDDVFVFLMHSLDEILR